MVQQDRHVMAFPDQFAHAPILAQQAAGKCPLVIIFSQLICLLPAVGI
jgi:hypothetical protein